MKTARSLWALACQYLWRLGLLAESYRSLAGYGIAQVRRAISQRLLVDSHRLQDTLILVGKIFRIFVLKSIEFMAGPSWTLKIATVAACCI
ncbi:MAG: hypothetical protein DWH82_04915 [Planctomycetota bacterium]|nr:MAG: hypothetical protein DWH82_04915 [Planctomycetota bacterium]